MFRRVCLASFRAFWTASSELFGEVPTSSMILTTAMAASFFGDSCPTYPGLSDSTSSSWVSTDSSDAAVEAALNDARQTLRNIKAVDVVSTGLRGENLDEWRALVRISFLIERVSE